jgi:hypothetical protein
VPFNAVDETGVVRNLAPVSGLIAKVEDAKFIDLLTSRGALVAAVRKKPQ